MLTLVPGPLELRPSDILIDRFTEWKSITSVGDLTRLEFSSLQQEPDLVL